jgi:cobalamin-dependent methionine synthase I
MIVVADNLHALNPIVAEALRTLDPKPLQDLALRCEKAGANLLDINPGFLSQRQEDRMAFMVEAVQEVTSLPLILDSPSPRLLARGLSVCRQKPILNGLSLEEHKLNEILPLAVENGARLVLLLMDEKSYTPPGVEEKLAIALTLRDHALAAGLKEEALIFDPILPNLSWHDAFALVSKVVGTIRMLSSGSILKEPADTMVGLSNLRSGLKRIYPLAVEATCLSILAGAELRYVLANVLDPELMATVQLINQMAQ